MLEIRSFVLEKAKWLPVLCLWEFVVLLATSRCLFAASGTEETQISFCAEIAPILVKRCLTCHGPEKAKGGYRLDTFESLVRAGKSQSPSVTSAHPEQSKLYELITATNSDDRMPQKDDPLTITQVRLIEQWIKQGAHFDGTNTSASLSSIIPRMPHPQPPLVYSRPMPVTALAFEPLGRELASSGYHEILIWDAVDGKLARRIGNVAKRTQGLAYNQDGTVLAAAGGRPGEFGEVSLINPIKGEVTKALGTFPDMALSATFSPDGQLLAASGADNSIHLYDQLSGMEKRVIQQHADWVMSIRFNSDGDQLVSASRDRSARIYNSRTGELETSYTEHNAPVFSAAFSHDGSQVFSAGRDKKIHIWNPKDGRKIAEIGGFEEDIYQVIVDGDHVFSCSADKLVRLHSIKDRKLIHTFVGHTDWVYSLAYDRERKRLASGGYDGEIRIWNVEDGKSIIAFQATPGQVASK